MEPQGRRDTANTPIDNRIRNHRKQLEVSAETLAIINTRVAISFLYTARLAR